jgi:hypothetical protein
MELTKQEGWDIWKTAFWTICWHREKHYALMITWYYATHAFLSDAENKEFGSYFMNGNFDKIKMFLKLKGYGFSI